MGGEEEVLTERPEHTPMGVHLDGPETLCNQSKGGPIRLSIGCLFAPAISARHIRGKLMNHGLK